MKYKFMWGQKQSAMITEAMLSQVLFDIDHDGNIIDSNIDETLFILTDGTFEHYLPETSISRLEKNSYKLLDLKFAGMLFKQIDAHIKNFFRFCDKVNDKDLKLLSDADLKQLFVFYHEFIKKTFVHFEFSTPAGTALLVEKIKLILKQKIEDDKLVEDYFISLSSPEELDETMKERLDFLKLKDQEAVSQKDIERYSRAYPALFFNTYDKNVVMNFLRNRIEEERKVDTLSETQRIHSNLSEIRDAHQNIYSLFADAAVDGCILKDYAEVLQKSALVRYKLKHVWSGGEYLCLDLLQEIHRRISFDVSRINNSLDFDDFISTYMFSDVLAFFDSGKRLTEKEVSSRKKCIFIHYTDKKLNYYFGQEAISHKFRLGLDKDEQNLTDPRQNPSIQNCPAQNYPLHIKGTIANKGTVRGIARIVNVKDLSQFVDDNRLFKKGEILVTTMTSPLMVLIIAKAGGIITDEGGITSHAAVISREFKIPCLVGTHGASSIIKTGDLVELDADKGWVKIQKSM